MRFDWAEPMITPLVLPLIRLWAGTWRYEVQGWENVAAARATRRPIVYVLWHSRLLPLIHSRRGEGTAILISRHRDGSYLTRLCEGWGYRVVRGSHRRGGAVGLLGLIRYLQSGGEVGTTPDGPRGPREKVKPGLLLAAQHANALVIAMGARPSSAWWWTHTWDRFCVPRPFTKIEVHYSPPISVAEGKEGLRQGIADAERALQEVTYGRNGGAGKGKG